MTTTDARSLPLATPCGTCDHTHNWHNIDGCTITACGCGLFTAPVGALAGREQRRRVTANILARIDRAKHIQEDEAALLRTLVTAEQADADQAREQLADLHAAESADAAAGSYAGRAEQAEAERDAARKDAADARIRSGHHIADARRNRDAWRNARRRAVKAEQRAREAEQRLHLIDGMRQNNLDAALAARQQREQAEISAHANKTAAIEALARAEAAEDGRVAADNMLRAVCAVFGGPHKDPVVEARETLERAEKAEAEVKRLSAKLTAAQAENDGLAECMRNTDQLTTAEATELRISAERAEAGIRALTAQLQTIEADRDRLAGELDLIRRIARTGD